MMRAFAAHIIDVRETIRMSDLVDCACDIDGECDACNAIGALDDVLSLYRMMLRAGDGLV